MRPAIMSGLICLLLAIVVSTGRSSEIAESVDLIEFNHFHDVKGNEVYQQMIFYEWSHERNQYEVRAWLLDDERDGQSRRPTRTYSDNRYHVRWFDRDQKINRHLHSVHFRESWSQVDPERANKTLLPEAARVALVKMESK